MSFAEGTALNGKATNEILNVDNFGFSALAVRNRGDVAIVPYYRRKNGKFAAMVGNTKYADESVDSNTDFLVNTPVAPGTLSVTSPTLTIKDRDGDGKLYLDRKVNATVAEGVNGVTSAITSKTLTAAGETFATKGVFPGDIVALKTSQDAGVFTVETVTSETVLVLDRAFPIGSQTSVEYRVVSADLIVGAIDYFTGKLRIMFPGSGTMPGTRGSVVGLTAFPLNLDPADQLSVDIDGAGAALATFDAAPSTLPGAAGTFAAMAAETMEARFSVGGVWGEWHLVTFSTEASLQLAANTINNQVAGGYALENAGQIDIESNGRGTGARVETRNVDAAITTKLGIPDATVSTAGAGDVANINEVSLAEFKAVVEADVAGSLVTLDDVTGGPRITSDGANFGVASSVLIAAGSVATAASLSTTLATGGDAGATYSMTASYTKTLKIDASQRATHNIVVASGDEISVRFAANGIATTPLVGVNVSQ